MPLRGSLQWFPDSKHSDSSAVHGKSLPNFITVMVVPHFALVRDATPRHSHQVAVELFDTFIQQLISVQCVRPKKHSTKQVFVMLHQISLNNNMLIYMFLHLIFWTMFWTELCVKTLNKCRASIMVDCFDSCISKIDQLQDYIF